MDLHDGIIQSIYAVGLTLEYCNLLLDEDPSAAKGQLGQAISGLNDVIRDIRNYILDLRPQRFQGKDLPSGLFELIRAFRANTLIQADLQVDMDGDVALLPSQASGLFHIAQEALANVAKHARARQVSVLLSRDKTYVTLMVQDNGQGFDPERVAAYEGHGLRNMDARAHTLGGKVSVESEIGKGTTVRVTVPIEPIGGRGT
jgi:signal transduction histidine kinase